MIDTADIHRLISQPDADRTLSVFLMTDAARLENHAATPGWRIWLKNAMRELKNQHPEDETFDALRKRTEALLEQHRGHSKAMALFLTPSSEQIFELPVPLAENAVAYGRASLAPLLFAMDEYERTLIVVVDQERARFISGYMGGASREGTHVNDVEAYDFRSKDQMPTGRNQGDRTMGGSNRDAFEATIGDHLRRFYQEVAAQARQIVETQGIKRILLGGPGEAAHALKREMHDTIARQVVAMVPIPQWVDDNAVVRLALPAALAVEHQQEVELVEEVVGLAKSGNRGALGRVAVEDCLKRQQVELLILPWPLSDPDLRDRLPLAALAAGAKIEFVSGAAAERVIAEGGVAARLFYTVRPEFGDQPQS
ncbi:MAG: hypothetical protein H0T76_19320 [Nannocystis sp.]|nr:VLRF1 family aeRF1-type release factor [Nannocystis sp.]MBA3548641.1 hypothetical protein [Nannocystis sp.]